MSNNTEKSSSSEMTFFEHIDALRPHLVRASAALFLMMIAAFFAKRFIIDMILAAPKSPDFPMNKFLCFLSQRVLGNDTLCINNVEFDMVNTTLGGQFNIHMQVTFVAALVIAIPYLLLEVWRFISPALTDKERHGSRMFVFYVSLCFFTGLLFGYFLIVPLSINFLYSYTASDSIVNLITFQSYLSTVLNVSLGCALVFQLPLIIYFLTRLGIVSAPFLKRYRKHALLILTIISAIITPPDLLSLVLVIMPLYALYELSISIAVRVGKKKTKREQAELVRYSE